jgi:hypothetical protein
VGDSGFASCDYKSDFFMEDDRHVHFFLLLLNDPSAPCLGAAHSGPSLTLMKALSIGTWGSGTE